MSSGLEQGAVSGTAEASIHEVISRHLDPSTGSLRGARVELPDEDRFREREEAAGEAPAAESAQELAALMDRAVRTPMSQDLARCHERLTDPAVTRQLDEVLGELGKRQTPSGPLGAFALSLATGSSDRGAVIAGLALLGLARAHEHQDVVMRLGAHPAFSQHAATCLRRMLPDATYALWELARRVDGPARVAVVERMEPTEDIGVQQWLRQDGYQSDMAGGGALRMARVGRLLSALQPPEVAATALAGACALVSALITAAPAVQAMERYEDGAQVCRLLLEHLETAPPDLHHLEAGFAIQRFLTEEGGRRAQEAGWDEAGIGHALSRARLLTARTHWEGLVREGLESQDPELFRRADVCAASLGIDTFEAHWRRLLKAPQDPRGWQRVVGMAREDRIGQIVAYAQEHLPLKEIASGAAMEYGLSAGFNPYTCLSLVLQELPRFPGQGQQLILAGLASPVAYNRAKAVAALAAWPAERRTGFKFALLRARREEGVEAIREQLAGLC